MHREGAWVAIFKGNKVLVILVNHLHAKKKYFYRTDDGHRKKESFLYFYSNEMVYYNIDYRILYLINKE